VLKVLAYTTCQDHQEGGTGKRSCLSIFVVVALGAAAENSKPERVYDAIDSGVLAMDAYVFA
jgi:hypothetical protein